MDKNYKNEGLRGNGSFYTESTGRVRYSGIQSEDKNQVVAFDPRNGGQYMAVDLSEMLMQQNYEFAESIVDSKEPKYRKSEEELRSGDLWWDKSDDYAGYVHDEGEFKALPRSENPPGTIIRSIYPTPPSGYLTCDGSDCPSSASIYAFLQAENNGKLPSLPQSSNNYNYIKS